MIARRSRNCVKPSLLMSSPSISMVPLYVSRMRKSAWVSVDFPVKRDTPGQYCSTGLHNLHTPAPVLPTTPTFSPPWIWRLKLRTTDGSSKR